MRSCNNAARAAALVALAAVAFTAVGCSDIYYDRRDTIGLGAGDSLAANQAVQMVDPWPPASANRNIPFDGYRMEAAVERYRANRVIPPSNSGTSSADYQQSQSAAPATMNNASAGTAAAVK